MPKDEFDFEDPLELSGVGLVTSEDNSELMSECICEEFLRMGYNPRQVLALFQNPNYIGPNMVCQNRGEPFVRAVIARVFAQWGRPFIWPGAPEQESVSVEANTPPPATLEMDPGATDPTGAAIPKF
jgi:hypothetical protein